jgi:hypothetical protein
MGSEGSREDFEITGRPHVVRALTRVRPVVDGRSGPTPGARIAEQSRQVVENKRWDVREILKDSKNNRSSPRDTGMLPVLEEWFDGRSGPTPREQE